MLGKTSRAQLAFLVLGAALILAGCVQTDGPASVPTPSSAPAKVAPTAPIGTGAFTGSLDALLLSESDISDNGFKLQKRESLEKAPSPFPKNGWKSGKTISYLKSESGEKTRLWQIKQEVLRYEPDLLADALESAVNVKENTQKVLSATGNPIQVTRLADPGVGTQSALYRTELDPDEPDGMVAWEVFFIDRQILQAVSLVGPDVTQETALALAGKARERLDSA